jgi:hypothetical protein
MTLRERLENVPSGPVPLEDAERLLNGAETLFLQGTERIRRVEVVIEFFQRLRSPEELIRWGGYTALVSIVFAETGLLVGFFLPGIPCW